MASPPLPNDDEQQQWWASDSSGNKELDPELKEAYKVAKKVHVDEQNDCKQQQKWFEAETTEPILLRNLLSDEQIDEILACVSLEGAWPRGIKADAHEEEEEQKVDEYNKEACEELQSVAHHYAWTENHVALYMHNNDYWFVRQLPEQWSRIRGGMESRPWMNGAIPVLDDAFIGVGTESMTQVRCIELHHYAAGGGLLTPGHRDYNSSLTISVLLSDPADVSGGDFVTYNHLDGSPVAHKMSRGDAILFNSHKLHNIATVTGGVRKSLVVELWPSKRY